MVLARKKDIPDYLLADPVAPELSWETGSLGSPVLALRGGRPDILSRVADAYAERFRKGWRDLRHGVAVFMAPSRAHEYSTRNARELVEALGAALRLSVVTAGSATLRGGDGRRGEPDESFYVGGKAERYRAMVRAGLSEDDIGERFRDTPADGVGEALRVLREIGGLVEFSQALGRGEPVAERVLAAAGAAQPDGSAPPRPPGSVE